MDYSMTYPGPINSKLYVEKNINLDLTDKKIKELFKKEIIIKGLDVYQNDKVLSEQVQNDDHIFEVNSISKEITYSVNLKIVDNKLIEMSCDCPCNFNCKHEYACLLYIKDELLEKEEK